MLEDAIRAKPYLATNTGNQRMQNPGRRIAVDILRKNLLGKAISAHVWTGTRRGSAKDLELPAEQQPPANIDWDLWVGPAAMQPYRDGIAPNKWRAWWDFGTAGLGDWGVHWLDQILWWTDEKYPTQVHSVGGRPVTASSWCWCTSRAKAGRA